MKNYTMKKLNIRKAVVTIEKKIAKGKNGIIIDTEFGKLGIEINPTHDINPFHPVFIVPWDQSPETVWAYENKKLNATYYVGINIFETESLDHLAVIEAMIRVMFLSSGFDIVPDNIIDTAVQSYHNNYDSENITITSLVKDYMDIHLGFVSGRSVAVQHVVREMFQQKISAAKEISTISKDLISNYETSGMIGDEVFNDKFCEEIFGIMLYTNMMRKSIMKKSESIMIGERFA